ncbi:g11612 [Coccomyxa viridis]|uniref:G11612 protein n=1 Tax=Coccomyxa viridis TaxID=1274662 RepID=A0ABP1G8B8_9CHLO
MADQEDGRRLRRRRAGNNAAMPSAVHYVGYVEEDETPEMIMKKFEELEKVMAHSEGPANAAGPAPQEQTAQPDAPGEQLHKGAGLTEAQLMEVFKQTSIFNVRSALANNHALMSAREVDEANERWMDSEELSEDEDLWAEMREFWSDGEELEGLRKAPARRARKEPRRQRGPNQPRTGGLGHSKLRHQIVTHYNAVTQALIRRRVRVVDEDALYRIMVPQPLPLSWGRTVQPYDPSISLLSRVKGTEQSGQSMPGEDCDQDADASSNECSTSYHHAQDISRADFKAIGTAFQAVLINQGWECKSAEGKAVAARLAKVPMTQLCPIGFIFIWVDKTLIAEVVNLMDNWGFSYVENLTWVHMAPNNTVVAAPSLYARRSHLSLFIFRKSGEGKDIELRHQRNPDVLFDSVRQEEGQALGVPEEAFYAIETLLPTGKGRFLELWAPYKARRPGWVHVSEAANTEL